jgi:hypothetical protein
MTAYNGFDGSDPVLYTYVSRFFIIVQRGRVLPYIFEEDIILTKDFFWLITGPSLIPSGVTVTVTEGTQLQFFSGDPSDPNNPSPRAYIQVEGSLSIEGTDAEPVEMFPGFLYQPYPLVIVQVPGGNTSIHYARIANPVIGGGNMYAGLMYHSFCKS